MLLFCLLFGIDKEVTETESFPSFGDVLAIAKNNFWEGILTSTIIKTISVRICLWFILHKLYFEFCS